MNPHSPHWPARRLRSASAASRLAANINKNAKSAVVLSSTPGVLQTAIPKDRAAVTSTLS